MNQHNDFSLRGYLDAIRRQKLLIFLVVVACGLVGGAYAALKKVQYTATASLSVSDPSASLAAGGSLISEQTPLQLASAAAPQVTRGEVVRAVQQRLSGTGGVSSGSGDAAALAALRNRITVSIDPNSYVVDIEATGPTAASAEALANSFAQADTALSNAESRRGYARQAAAVRAQLRRMSPNSTQAVTTASTLARLQNLASVASPVSVNITATGASGPTTVKKVETTAAAALFGLLLGIALATGRDALDRRLRRPEEIAKVLDYAVIGSIRHEALGHAGTAPAADKKVPGPLEERDLESFRILRQNLNFLSPESAGRIVIVTSPMSEEGKSTVAAGLAAATAESGKRVLLVECDLRKPVMAARHGLRSAPGLTDFLTGGAQPVEVLQVVPRVPAAAALALQSPAGGPVASLEEGVLVSIVAGSTLPRPGDLLQSEEFRGFLAEVSEAYDLVILDTPPLLPVADTLELIPMASAVLLCVRVRQTTRDQAEAARSALERLPAKPTGLVLTDVREDEAGYYGGYYGYRAAES